MLCELSQRWNSILRADTMFSLETLPKGRWHRLSTGLISIQSLCWAFRNHVELICKIYANVRCNSILVGPPTIKCNVNPSVATDFINVDLMGYLKNGCLSKHGLLVSNKKSKEKNESFQTLHPMIICFYKVTFYKTVLHTLLQPGQVESFIDENMSQDHIH